MTWEREMAEKRDCNLGIRISCSLKEALEEAADREGRTVSNYVEQIFKAHLEKSKKRKR